MTMDPSEDWGDDAAKNNLDALAAREEALLRANAALDSALPDVVSDVDALLDRQRRDEIALAGRGFSGRADDEPLRPDSAARRMVAAAAASANHTTTASSSARKEPEPGKTRWRSARLSVDDDDDDNDDEDQLPKQIGSDAAARYRKARVAALQEEAREAKEKALAVERRASAAEAEAATAEAAHKALRREVAQLKAAVDKEARARAEAEAEATGLRHKLQAADRALRDTRKEASQIGSEHRAGDVRLARAVEQADKLKQQLDRDKAASRDALDEARKSRVALEAQLKKADRQKVELLAAFRKQLKLIDVLKRQKIHMEAARLLAFTEDEFIKVVSWDTDAKATTTTTTTTATMGRGGGPRATT